jgi:hypothetical protein
MQVHHPSHKIVAALPGPRVYLKPTLQSKYGQSLVPYLNQDGIIPQSIYKKVMSALHTSATKSAIKNLALNRVLGRRTPEVHKSKQELPRAYRTNLNQLRSDFCDGLSSYKHFIGASKDDRCPDCHLLPHSTFHLFNCPANLTDLVYRGPLETSQEGF